MARKVKFALFLKDDEQVRNLDDLKKYFDVEKIVGYFNDGRLLRWLNDRYYSEEAEQVEQLTKDDPQLHKKLCAIFGVDSQVEELDVEEIARRTERLNRLKQYTDDRNIWAHVDQVAFDQEDLSDLLDEDATLIYLCNNRFTIPLRVTDKNYIGIGKAVAVIRSNKIVDFSALNITFKGVKFDDDYNAVLKAKELAEQKKLDDEKAALPKKLFDEGDAADRAGDYETALAKFKASAELDYAPAFAAVGMMYFVDEGIPKDDDEARRWFELGIEKNDGDSFAGPGILLLNTDDAKAFEMFKRADELDSEADVKYFLGNMYREGTGTEKNLAEAFDCYKKGCDAGDRACFKMLGLMYHNGEYVEKNPEKAFELTKAAAEGGDVEAMNIVGSMYYDGYGVSQNYGEAFRWCLAAAEGGDSEAMNVVGNMYMRGKGVSKNYDEAFRWYKLATDAGELWGMFNLSHMYRRGRGTAPNTAEGIRLLEKAAQLGLIDAWTKLGYLYRDGDGVAKDFYKAANYFKRAADAGDGEGMNGLGLLYDFGQGVKEDKNLAFQWFLKSAEAGTLIGMANVGTCYMWGQGTSKDMAKAGYWLQQAAEGENFYGMLRYGDYLFEYNAPNALSWYKKAYEVSESGETAYKIYKIYSEGKCGVSKSTGDANYWERTYKNLGYKPDDGGGCFITTAVCSSFGKTDDCYELTTFRNFRDEWLTAQPDGKSLIAEYYSIAPRIVDKINSLIDAAQVYKNIWRDYLEPCLSFIHSGDNCACKNKYVEMVASLKKKFLEG